MTTRRGRPGERRRFGKAIKQWDAEKGKWVRVRRPQPRGNVVADAIRQAWAQSDS